jgi:hypothetical protein
VWARNLPRYQRNDAFAQVSEPHRFGFGSRRSRVRIPPPRPGKGSRKKAQTYT